MNFQNIIRGIITTVLGVALICISLGDYFEIPRYYGFQGEGIMNLYEAMGLFLFGVALLLMPDDIPAFIRKLANKFIFKSEQPKKEG